MNIRGKVVYMDLATGFWGIVDDSGRKWRPVEMPKRLQKVDLEVDVTAAPVDEDVSIFMWGTPIRILDTA